MQSNESRKSKDAHSVSGILASLAELTKRSDFEELKEMIPLLSDLKKTENHNREMNDILGVVEKALSEIKSNCAGTSRTVTTCANTLDRMVSQLAHEVNKLQSCLERLSSQHVNFEDKLKGEVDCECEQTAREIDCLVQASTKKLKEEIYRQERDLCISAPFPINKYKLSLLRHKVQKDQQIRENYLQCQTIFGELCCSLAHNKIAKKDSASSLPPEAPSSMDLFITQAQKHFQRDYPFVISRLKFFDHIPEPNAYEQTIFHQCYAWANRLRISLEAAIIKLSIRLRQSLQISEEQHRVVEWQRTLEKWEGMHSELNVLLE